MVYVYASQRANNSHYNANLSTNPPRTSLVLAFSIVENAPNRLKLYPFQRIFQNRPPYGKDRQRYPLYLTVF
jgi:hypothetical protein